MKTMDTISLKTPVGDLTLFAQGDAIIALDWGQGMNAPRTSNSAVLTRAAQALTAYFKTGALDLSGIKLEPSGTPFQKRVWREMQKIKTGQSKTYGQLAATLKTAARPIGGACAANPIPILIPCHRVLSAGGKLGHYSGGDGSDTKQFLLRLEGVAI